MGFLVNGEWVDQWYDTKKTGGEFKRQPAQFHCKIGDKQYPAEANRYHLYISFACPWACRTLMFRKLKKLEDIISLSIVDPLMLENGWEFTENPGCIPDTVNGFQFLHQVYTLAKPDYTGRVTVPVLWDKKTSSIVCNESADIIRMLNTGFNHFTDVKTDYYPEHLRKAIDAINQRIYQHINNGVYKCGFATKQAAYEKAFENLFNELDALELLLSKQRYLVGNQITEADWRLFTTLIRFDVVYVGHFKCNLHRIQDYPNLYNYLLELYQHPGIKETVNIDHIKHHYYISHKNINPTGIVPVGPKINLDQPNNRNKI